VRNREGEREREREKEKKPNMKLVDYMKEKN